MEVQIAVAKTNKYAVTESGDTLEVVERPNGGLSVVLADGQTSGRGAKAVSMLVVRKVIGLLAEGVRDGAAARAASDSLYTDKQGKVSATLNIISVDLHTGTVVLSRNNPAPFFVAHGERVDCISTESSQIGVRRDTRPVISEIPVEAGLVIVIYTDGLVHAGSRTGQPMDVCTSLKAMLEDQEPSPQAIADALLAEAVALDDGRPGGRYQRGGPQGAQTARGCGTPDDGPSADRHDEVSMAGGRSSALTALANGLARDPDPAQGIPTPGADLPDRHPGSGLAVLLSGTPGGRTALQCAGSRLPDADAGIPAAQR